MSEGLLLALDRSAGLVTTEYERLVGLGADQPHADAHAAFQLAGHLSAFLHAVDDVLVCDRITEGTRREVLDSSAHAVLVQLVDEQARASGLALQPHLLVHDAYFQDLQRHHLGTVYGCMVKVWEVLHPSHGKTPG